MANKKQPERWEASLLASVMAVAGAPYLFDKLGSLVQTSMVSLGVVLHSAPALLVVAGAILLLADQSAMTTDAGNRRPKEGRYEL
jgi:hypothetical protein